MDFFGNNTTQEDATKQPNSFTDTFNAKVQELKDDRQQNFNRYGLEVSPEEYELLNEVTKTTQDPYRTATAYKISKEMDLPFQDVYSNLDSYVLPIVGTDKDKYTSENWYKSICDNFTIGTNNNKIGALGLKLMEAQYSGNTELADAILKEYQAIADYNNTLMQENAEYWGHDIIDAGMQSLPFTLPAMGLSLIPAVGPAASFVYSSATMSGMEYMDLKSQGVSDTTARNTAVIAGALEGIVEVTLGNVAGAIGAKMGESAAGEFLRRNAIDKITSKVAYKMHGSGKFRAIANLLGRTTLENLEEGAEEVVQESISIIASAIANEIDDTGYEGMTASEIARDLWENGKGGFLGSILLSSPTFMMNTKATVQDYKAVKSAAQDIPSKEVFVKAVADSPVFEGMSEEQKKQTASEIWESTDRRRKETAEMEEDAIAEVYSADESMETIEKEYDENGLEKEPNIPDVYRDNKGGLHFENTMKSDNKGVLSVGNPTKENANRYGRIEYTIDEDTNTVTIDQFKMSNHREDLRNDLFMDFAERFTGYNIEWNTKGKLAADIKEKLSDLNPQGKDKGLSFFNIEEDNTNSKARIEVARQIMANTNFSEKESIAAVGFFETLAKSLNKDVNTFLNENFGGKIFATEEQAEQSKKSFSEYKTNNVNSFINRGFTGENLTEFQKEQNAVISNLTAEEKKTIADYVNAENGLTSGVTKEQTEAIRKLIDIKPEAEEIIDYAEVLASQKMKGTQIQDGVRAAIYAGENADFSTWVHELAHVYRRALDGDKLYELEKAFGFDHGTWNREMEEQFAQSFEEYLRTGKAKNNQLKELFRQIADFIADVYKYLTSSVGGVKLNDDIIKVFDEIVSNEDSALAEAYQAVKEVQAENKEVQNVNEVSTKADSNKQEEQKAVTEEPAEVKPENEIAENTTLDDVTAEAVTSIISDESLSDTEKNGALVNAASEQRDFDIFQIIGEEGAKNLDQANEETIRMDNLNIAKEMETAGKDAKTIRLATGWEKGADGKWKYEIDDIKIKENPVYETDEGNYKLSKLSDVIEAEELFKAYPELKNVIVQIQDLPGGHSGSFSEPNKYFPYGILTLSSGYLKTENPDFTRLYEEFKENNQDWKKWLEKESEYDNKQITAEDFLKWEESVWEKSEGYKYYNDLLMGRIVPRMIEKLRGETIILHELQHAIQNIEGFAKGGSSNSFANESYIKFLNIASNAKDMAYKVIEADRALNEIPEYKALSDVEYFDERYDELNEKLENTEEYKKAVSLVKEFNNKYPYFDTHELIENYKDHVSEVYRNHLNDYGLSPYQLYNSLSGEVEARNVQTRSKFTAEERREQLLSDTEDRRRDQQLVLFQEEQEEEIRKQYENTDKWMKAPNGADTKLTEKQWLQTRTSSFKNWFGDWENDPQNASKVVDENGEPLVVYHGSNHWFNEFNNGKEIQHSKAPKGSIFATDNREAAISYTGYYGDKDPNSRRNVILDVDSPEHERLSWGIYRKGGIYEMFANIRNPFEVDFEGNLFKTEDGFYDVNEEVKWVLENGNGKYDGLIVRNIKDYGLIDTKDIKEAPAFTDIVGFNSNQFKSADQNKGTFDSSNPSILFQTAYHGTSADFDNFDLNYGMSGEGSMSFGYGVYVTGSEEIARDYAKRQQEEKSGKFIEDEISYDEKRIAEKEKELSDYVSFEEFKNKHEESINNLISKIEIRKQKGESTEILENILKGKKARNIEEDYENNKKAIEKDIEDYKKDIEENLAKIEKLKANGEAKRHLYTVDIPDNGFIKWDKNVRSSTVDKIGTALFRKLAYEPNEYGEYDYKGVENELKKELNDVFNSEYTGQSLYGTVSSYLGGDKQASEFLASIGYNGIDYPAGTNFGNGKDIDARNYVIFKEKKAKILSNVLFQTSENDLIALAKEFENWTQFMEYCEDVVPKADVEKLTKNADTDWYRNLWEMANTEGVTTSQLEQEEYARQKALEEEDRLDPIIIDAVFKSNILKKPEMLDTFLQRIYDVQNTDLEQFRGTAEDWEEIGAPLEELQNRIRTSLKHGTWLSNAQRIQGGKQLTKEARNLMQKLIAHNLRQYRALYSLVMDDPYYAVRDDYITNLNEEGKKYGLNKDVENMSIEEMGRYADSISDKKLREKVRNGNVTIDELEDYVEDLDERTRNAEKKQKQNELEIQKAINDLSSSQEKTLLKLYGELIGVQAEMEIKKIPVPKEVKQTLKTIDYVNKPGAKLQARYEDLYKQYKDIEKAANVSGEAQALIKRIDLAKESKIEFKKLVKEQKAIDELKELRKKLVKRAMRKVSFDTVDYDTARAIIAVQQIFNSNLKNDVNEWIGKQGATAREIWSDYKTGTDEERKAMEKRFLRTQKTMDLFRKLRETNKAEELQDWAEKDIKALERLFTKSNWYKELQLDRLKEGRDNAIQLDIKEVVRGRATGYNADGSEYVTPVSMAEYSDEIAELVEDNLGSEILEKITYKPFNMWSISEMEDFVADLNNARRYGRDKLNAKKMREDMNAARLRDLILKQVRDTGIVINDDDSDKIKEKKQEKINKILGVSSSIKGTMDDHKTETRLNQILHGYMDANVRRVARILDNYSEGTVTQLLYWRENECFNVQERSKDKRISRIESLFNDNNVSVEDLYETREFDFGDGIKHVMSVDELLFFAQAERNNNAYDAEQQAMGIEEYEREEETSYEAVVYGNLMGADEKKRYIDQSRNFYDEIQKKQAEIVQAAGNGTEGVEKMQVELENLYTELKGVRESMKSECKRRMDIVLSEYYKVLAEKPGLAKLQDAIAKDYTDEFARINKASIEEFNQPVWREKWYLPLIRLELTGDTHEARVRADLLGNAAGTGKAGTEKGFTKKRIKIAPENQRPVETGLYKTWVDSVNRTEHFIAYASYVRELNRVFTNRDAAELKQSLQNRYGRPMTSYIDSYIKEVANPDRGEPTQGLDKLVRTLRGNVAPAYLAWKASSIIKQGLSSPAPFAQFINPIEYLNGAMALTHRETRDAINSKSAFMKNRVMDPMMDIIKDNELKAQSKAKHALKAFETKGMAGLEWIDYVCVAPGWYAIYKKAYNEGLKTQEARYQARVSELETLNESRSWKDKLPKENIMNQAMEEVLEDIEAEAVNKADDCVRLCQPSNRKTDLAPLFKNGNEIQKALLQFTTSLNVIWQNIRYDIPYAVRQKQFKDVVTMILGYAGAGLAMGLVCDGLGGDDEDEADKARKLVYYSTTQFTDSIPVLGAAITSASNRIITGEKGFMSNGTDLFPTFTKLKEGTFALTEGNIKKAAAKLSEGFALSTGLPVSATKELLYASGLNAEDKEIHPEAFVGRRED